MEELTVVGSELCLPIEEEFEGKGFVVFCVFLAIIGSEGKNEVDVFI
jgi:hypothetical protein